jgi:hypothetical protein
MWHIQETTGAYRLLVGKPERKRPLGRPRRRWDDNVTMDYQNVRWKGKYWIDLSQGGEK